MKHLMIIFIHMAFSDKKEVVVADEIEHKYYNK
jgi:hypothetical protein